MANYEVKYGNGTTAYFIQASSETEAVNKFKTQYDAGKKGEPVVSVRKVG